MQFGDKVVYIPPQANGDPKHQDCIRGEVFAISGNGFVGIMRQDGTMEHFRAIDLVVEAI